MTRRAAGRSGKVLSLNQYVHRTTLGLPKAERVDAAAELRAHLLERVEKLEQEGFARDEAEFLAVQAMGDPQVTNRQLLGHLFTTLLGWAVLGLALLGGGVWWTSQALRPVGIWPSALRPMDFFAINQEPAGVWPQGWSGPFTQAANLRFPIGTEYVFAAFMNYGDPELRPSFTFSIVSNQSTSVIESPQKSKIERALLESSFRFIAIAAPDTSGHSCPKNKAQLSSLIYSTNQYKISAGARLTNRDGISFTNGLGGGLCVQNLNNTVTINKAPLSLNTWTKVYQVWGVPDGKLNGQQVSYAMLLFPTDKAKPPMLRPEQAYTSNEKTGQWETGPETIQP